MTELQPTTGNGKSGDSLDTEEIIKKTRTVLRDRLDQNPYVVLGVAGAVGYVLAAGMPRPLLGYLFRYGVRTGLRAGLRSVLGSIIPGDEEPEHER